MKAIVLCLFGAAAVSAVQFEILNRVPGPIWIGTLGNSNKPALENGGFVLNQNERKTINAPDDWAGRFWARTWCDSNTNHCQTGDCGDRLECGGNGGAPPATLVEITLRGSGNQDFYDVSLVDGFNVVATIAPDNGACRTIGCNNNINDGCPNDLVVKEGGGQIIGCKSDCIAYNTDEACCRGSHNTPETCSPTNSANYFKGKCPDAYSYAYDDPSSTFTCLTDKYTITFG